jgi:hypothetical protein
MIRKLKGDMRVSSGVTLECPASLWEHSLLCSSGLYTQQRHRCARNEAHFKLKVLFTQYYALIVAGSVVVARLKTVDGSIRPDHAITSTHLKKMASKPGTRHYWSILLRGSIALVNLPFMFETSKSDTRSAQLGSRVS